MDLTFTQASSPAITPTGETPSSRTTKQTSTRRSLQSSPATGVTPSSRTTKQTLTQRSLQSSPATTSTLTWQTTPSNQDSTPNAFNRISKPQNANYISIAKTLQISDDEYSCFKVFA